MKLLEDRILVKLNERNNKTASGIIIPETMDKSRLVTGTILEIGPGKKNKLGEIIPMELKKDDIVLFDRFRGTEIEKTKFMLREEDIFATLDSHEDIRENWKDLTHLLPGEI